MIVHGRVDFSVKMSGTAIIRFYYRLKQKLGAVFFFRGNALLQTENFQNGFLSIIIF